MYCVQFIFEERDLSEEFFALDALIAQAAEDNSGFVGKDSWVSADGGRRNSIYYWRDEDALKLFSRHPKHLEAKKRYQEWYSGFHVVISQVTKTYGDHAFAHTTPNERGARKETTR